MLMSFEKRFLPFIVLSLVGLALFVLYKAKPVGEVNNDSTESTGGVVPEEMSVTDSRMPESARVVLEPESEEDTRLVRINLIEHWSYEEGIGDRGGLPFKTKVFERQIIHPGSCAEATYPTTYVLQSEVGGEINESDPRNCNISVDVRVGHRRISVNARNFLVSVPISRLQSGLEIEAPKEIVVGQYEHVPSFGPTGSNMSVGEAWQHAITTYTLNPSRGDALRHLAGATPPKDEEIVVEFVYDATTKSNPSVSPPPAP